LHLSSKSSSLESALASLVNQSIARVNKQVYFTLLPLGLRGRLRLGFLVTSSSLAVGSRAGKLLFLGAKIYQFKWHHALFLLAAAECKKYALFGPTKYRKEHKETRDPFAIRVRVRVAYLSSVIAIMSLEAK